MSRPARGTALALGVTVVVLAWIWPLPRELGRVLVGAGFRYDQYVSTYVLAHDARQLARAPARTFDASFCRPGLETLTTTEHFVGFGPLYGLAHALLPDPLAAYGLVVVVLFVLNGLAMAWVAWRWTDDAWAAFVAGVLYAGAPLRLGGAQWVQTTGTILFPLLPFAIDGVLFGRVGRAVPLLAAVVAVQVLMGVNATVYAAVLGGTFLVALVLAAPRPRPWRRLAWLPVAALPALPGAAWLARLYLHAAPPAGGDVGSAMLRQGASVFLLDPLGDGADLLRRLLRATGLRREAASGTIFPVDSGRVALVLGALGTATGVAAGGRTRARAVALAAVALVAVGAALGPGAVVVGGVAVPLPAAWLAALPVVSGLRMPERHLFAAAVALTLLAALGLAHLWRRWPVAVRAALAVACCLLGRADAGALVREPVPPLTPAPAHDILRTQGTGRAVVLEWPPVAPPEHAARWLAESTLHWQPTTLCFTSVYPPAWLHWADEALRVQDAAGFAQLAERTHAGWILVHRDRATFDPAWAAAAGARLVHEDATHALWARDGGDDDARARWNDPAATLGGVPRAPLPAADRRATLTVTPPPAPLRPATALRLDVAVTNPTSRPWPGDAPPGPGVVELVIAWRAPDGGRIEGVTEPDRRARRDAWPAPFRRALATAQALPDRTVPLRADVAPGATVHVTASLVTPPAPGPWQLTTALVQRDVGPFRLDDGSDVRTLPLVVGDAAQPPASR